MHKTRNISALNTLGLLVSWAAVTLARHAPSARHICRHCPYGYITGLPVPSQKRHLSRPYKPYRLTSHAWQQTGAFCDLWSWRAIWWVCWYLERVRLVGASQAGRHALLGHPLESSTDGEGAPGGLRKLRQGKQNRALHSQPQMRGSGTTVGLVQEQGFHFRETGCAVHQVPQTARESHMRGSLCDFLQQPCVGCG